jgi:hypothetical protein
MRSRKPVLSVGIWGAVIQMGGQKAANAPEMASVTDRKANALALVIAEKPSKLSVFSPFWG